jgi:hypothetical protein
MENYHYCDADAFLSIIKNKELWLSDLRNVNDPHELKSAPVIIKQKFESVFPTSKYKYPIDLDSPSSTFFSLSLSKEADLLSQWRAYSRNGTGFQIGIDVDALKACNLTHKTGVPVNYRGAVGVPLFEVSEVLYEEEEFSTLIENKLKRFLKEYQVPFESESRGLKLSDVFLIEDLIKDRCLLKHRFYEEEKEVRVFLHMDYQWIEETDFYRNSSLKGPLPQFRVNNIGLIPYVAISIFNTELDIQAVKSIKLGPNNNSRIEDVDMFLKINGFKDVHVSRSVSVRRSQVDAPI